ncbi:hypothetical protein D9M73_199420 [compost metagenome]
MLAPMPKSLISSTERSMMIGSGRFNGPREPAPAPMASRSSLSEAMTSGLATPGWLAALISFSSWSPRMIRAISLPFSSACTTRVLMVFSIGRLKPSTSCAMVLAFGVSTRRSCSVAAAREVSRGTASAFSMLAA